VEAVIEKAGNVTIVELPYEKIDASCKQEFQTDIAEALADPDGKIVFDMHRVQFVDSVGIGAIVSCLKQLSGSGGELKLCAVSKPVRSLFELVRLHRLLDILNTREEAIRAFEE
jgi:anti-sigma B factor antagonist